jgi:hypothetical protein
MISGVLLCVYPYVTDNLVWLCVIGAVLLVVPFVTDFWTVGRQRLYRGVSYFMCCGVRNAAGSNSGTRGPDPEVPVPDAATRNSLVE